MDGNCQTVVKSKWSLHVTFAQQPICALCPHHLFYIKTSCPTVPFSFMICRQFCHLFILFRVLNNVFALSTLALSQCLLSLCDNQPVNELRFHARLFLISSAPLLTLPTLFFWLKHCCSIGLLSFLAPWFSFGIFVHSSCLNRCRCLPLTRVLWDPL